MLAEQDEERPSPASKSKLSFPVWRFHIQTPSNGLSASEEQEWRGKLQHVCQALLDKSNVGQGMATTPEGVVFLAAAQPQVPALAAHKAADTLGDADTATFNAFAATQQAAPPTLDVIVFFGGEGRRKSSVQRTLSELMSALNGLLKLSSLRADDRRAQANVSLTLHPLTLLEAWANVPAAQAELALWSHRLVPQPTSMLDYLSRRGVNGQARALLGEGGAAFGTRMAQLTYVGADALGPPSKTAKVAMAPSHQQAAGGGGSSSMSNKDPLTPPPAHSAATDGLHDSSTLTAPAPRLEEIQQMMTKVCACAPWWAQDTAVTAHSRLPDLAHSCGERESWCV